MRAPAVPGKRAGIGGRDHADRFLREHGLAALSGTTFGRWREGSAHLVCECSGQQRARPRNPWAVLSPVSQRADDARSRA